MIQGVGHGLEAACSATHDTNPRVGLHEWLTGRSAVQRNHQFHDIIPDQKRGQRPVEDRTSSQFDERLAHTAHACPGSRRGHDHRHPAHVMASDGSGSRDTESKRV